jgi:hypothetical protein
MRGALVGTNLDGAHIYPNRGSQVLSGKMRYLTPEPL